MVKIAIPLKKQSDYTELKFVLRSIDHYLKEAEVIIVGEDLPGWINNVTWINLGDISGKKQLSVKLKILAALEYTEEILFTNDDIYFLSSTAVPYYHNGSLKAIGYTGSKELQDDLKGLGKPLKSFELHYPIIFKSDFKEIIPQFSSNSMIRSAYCNFLGIEGEQSADCKFVKNPKPDEVMRFINTLPFISTGVHSIQTVRPYLEKLFPNPSKFEI